MGKKSKQQKPQSRSEAPALTSPEGISGRGKKVISLGVATLVLGFIVLSRTDAMGRNWASHLSPFLILGAYVLIGAGIFLPDCSELPASEAPTSGPEKTT